MIFFKFFLVLLYKPVYLAQVSGPALLNLDLYCSVGVGKGCSVKVDWSIIELAMQIM